MKILTGGNRQLLKVDRFSRLVGSDGALVLLQMERLLFQYSRSKDIKMKENKQICTDINNNVAYADKLHH